MPSTNQMHVHGPGCGHIAIQHKNDVDYSTAAACNTLRAGTLMSTWSKLARPILTGAIWKPSRFRTQCGASTWSSCGDEAVPHGDHVDYLVDERLHHPHGDHCDDHGPLTVVSH